LASVAGISLLVGGIGIMNMMLTVVTERTKEIGLRKAIGAKTKDISLQFLLEAAVITIIGGIIGIILGWLISFAISKIAGISTSVSLFAILLSFGISGLIGIIFGYYPARRASKLNPIEALRYE
jgi:ABC-type antimicrobial peptide transport system permease subunit